MLESNIRYEVQKSPPASLLLLVRFVKLAISKLEIKSYRGVYIVTPEVISELGKADERNLYEMTPSTTQENFPVSYYQSDDTLLRYQ